MSASAGDGGLERVPAQVKQPARARARWPRAREMTASRGSSAGEACLRARGGGIAAAAHGI
jgi:hypothetical protein